MQGETARWEHLSGVRVAREILERAFGLGLVLLGPEGSVAHGRGGVVATSNAVCRRVLFTRAGFARCDAFYRRVAASPQGPCHLGFSLVSAPIEVSGEVLGRVCAAGFHDEPTPPGDLLEDVAALLPQGADHELQKDARTLPVVGPERRGPVRAVLEAAAAEIASFEANRARRDAGVEGLPGLWGLVGRSPQMQAVFDVMQRVAASEATVLVQGESGTGKELVARALHRQGRRRDREMVTQNCAAMPADLLESILFGHVRGAFSGAQRNNEGLFGAAHGGTLFLDEVGDMSPALQVKLLRVLQDGTYLPVGATTPRTADVRVIAATHRDLRSMVDEGTFRQDLFYRLHVLPVRLPPLRDRAGDLRLLVQHFAAVTENVPSRISDAAWECIERYAWPGNVRELRAEVQRWQLTTDAASELRPEHLSPQIRDAGGFAAMSGAAAAAAASGTGTLADAVEALERVIIERGLERTDGNRTRLAKDLGISRTTLGERLKRYDLD